MSKFKVGDRVTVSGIVTEVDDDELPYLIEFSGSDHSSTASLWFTEIEVSALIHHKDTTFRDQAAIAALQGLVVRHGRDDITDGNILGFSMVAFDFAEALDAERKKRDAL